MFIMPTFGNSTTVQDCPGYFSIRHCLDEKRFSQVISTVAPNSVLLFGVLLDAHGLTPTPEVPGTVIALISLPERVEPNLTIAVFEDQELVLTVRKAV